jgi:pimeloyl-ACP methyl ester carboxylesterase
MMLWLILGHLLLLSSFGVASSFVIQPRNWEYKTHYDIGFEVASSSASSMSRAATMLNQTVMTVENDSTQQSTATITSTSRTTNEQQQTPPILLLNGFGVGSFHQHRLISRLLEESSEQPRTIYAMDYLGQGRSWPKDCQDGLSKGELGLQYSAETWIDQIITFMEEVILPQHQGCKVHLVGNSVGGHLAAYIAARRPDLIETICLLNPTPVWGLNLPGWSGILPAPSIPKAIGRFLFDRIRDLQTIEKFLEQTYSRREAFSQELMDQIRGCTLGNGGHAAFASILWSPPLRVSPKQDSIDKKQKEDFQSCLAQVPCDVLLVFGKDDPWCKPAFAKKMLQALDQREPDSVHRYIEIENAGHCPNHEAPQAVAHVVRSWVEAEDRCREMLTLVDAPAGNKIVFHEDWGETAVAECGAEDIRLGMMDKLATTFI